MLTGDKKETNNFKNRRVFTNQKEYWGIPSNLFIGGAAICVGIAFLIFWWAGMALAVVYFSVMYRIHKKDPRAIHAWLRGMNRKNHCWVAGVAEPIQLRFLSSKGGGKSIESRRK